MGVTAQAPQGAGIDTGYGAGNTNILQGIGSGIQNGAQGVGNWLDKNVFNPNQYQVQQAQLGNEGDQRFASAIANAQGLANAPQTAAQQAQAGLMGQLQQTAAGQGPSIAGQMLTQAGQQNQAAQNAAVASARGNVNPALLQRNSMNAAANQNQNLAGQAATARMQEAQAAQGQLAGLSTNMQQQNMQQTDFANQLAAQYAGMGLTADQANLQANLQAQQIQSGVAQQNAGAKTNIVGGIISGAGSAAGLGKAAGGYIPGHASVQGDSQKNDTIPIMASAGEIIIPRSKAKDPDKAKEFIDHLMEQDGKSSKNKNPGDQSYGQILEAHKKLHERLSALEKRVGKGA